MLFETNDATSDERFLTIAISLLTFDSLGLDAVHAESSDIDALMEQITALDAQIYDLAAKDTHSPTTVRHTMLMVA